MRKNIIIRRPLSMVFLKKISSQKFMNLFHRSESRRKAAISNEVFYWNHLLLFLFVFLCTTQYRGGFSLFRLVYIVEMGILKTYIIRKDALQWTQLYFSFKCSHCDPIFQIKFLQSIFQYLRILTLKFYVYKINLVFII